MGNNIIKSFTINGLFGTTNLTIPFDDTVKILIGENGLGKTQVLNMLYYVLTQNWDKLENSIFENLSVNTNNHSIRILKSKVLDYSSMEDNFGNQNFYVQVTNAIQKKIPHYKKGIYPQEEVNEYIENVEEPITKITQGVKILYFPTYRRIEEDLYNLGYNDDLIEEDEEQDILINFGMHDIEYQLNELTQKIEKLSKDGLSKISGEILSQLIKGKPKIDYEFLEKIKSSDIEILLARVGNEISESDKDGIRELVSNGKKDIKDVYSLFFLQKLIEIYDQQRELDNRIKRFRDVCNKYLVNKKVIYDESQIEIYIKADGADKPLHLSKLSSGEKQIISIFSKFYLSEPDKRYIVLFDEPELSLSIFWQRNLLPDIVDSGKCELLFAVTHSPFIFENKLDKYTTSLAEYMTPLKPELVE